MNTYKLELAADVEMIGNDPHPPVLRTTTRPNFVVGEHYCLCFVLETMPASGIPMNSRGTLKAQVICAEDALPLFVVGGQFELVSANRVFATGQFRKIVAVNEADDDAGVRA